MQFATGGCYLTPDIAIKLASGRQDPLTKRERQVAENWRKEWR